MASYRKRKGGWRAEVCRNGIRKSATFDTKAEAAAWAGKIEAEILAGKSGAIPDKTFGALLERYSNEVSVTKRGERWERARIGLLLRDELAAVRLPELNASHIAAWRDRRLRQVLPASVRREWTLLSHACSVALREWRWLAEHPMLAVRRPAPSRARDRRIGGDEIEPLPFALGYDYDAPPLTQSARVGAAMLFAIETAMRAGEIVALRWSEVRAAQRHLTILSGKTAAASRDVALSGEAQRILRQLERVKAEGETVFRISSAQNLDAAFRKAKARALINDLHFHDTRHEAITRLARKLDVLDLARMVGHRDLRQLMVYYNASAEDIAGRLD